MGIILISNTYNFLEKKQTIFDIVVQGTNIAVAVARGAMSDFLLLNALFLPPERDYLEQARTIIARCFFTF